MGIKCGLPTIQAMLANHYTNVAHVLGTDGVKHDTKKEAVICDFQYTHDKTEFQSFLEMVNFLTRFIPQLSDKTPDLCEIL